jgi:hypothetical protein
MERLMSNRQKVHKITTLPSRQHEIIEAGPGVNYYAANLLAKNEIQAHICPFCRSYVLEAPFHWDQDDVQSIFREHIAECVPGVFEVKFS